MNSIRRRRRRTERAVAHAIEPANVVAEFAVASAVLKTRLNGIALPAVHTGTATWLLASVLGLDVEHAAGGIAVARRQDAIEETHLLDEHRIDHRDKRWIGIDVQRDHHAVYLVLKLRTFSVANMDLLILIDRDTGHLRQHVGDIGVLSLRQVGYILRGHRVLDCAG